MSYDHWLGAQKVCVLGAGTMGSGIAAHLANLGFHVTLFDLTSKSVLDGLEAGKAARPPHFYLPETAMRISLASMEGDLAPVAEADWVCEAIIENMDAKRDLFARIEPLLKPDAMVTTNTSGLEIGLLAEGRSAGFKKRFMGTHFFNPPRYLKLLELIPTTDTDKAAIKAMSQFLEERVARRVVVAKDTPGFISNRYGMWNMIYTVHVAERLQLTVEQVDAITGPFLGRPRSGSFRLNDLVGLDIMRDIAANLRERCPNDPGREQLLLPRTLEYLIGKGWIGEKSGHGYYRKEGKDLMAFDFRTNVYRQRLDPELPSLKSLEKLPFGERVAKALQLGDQVGDFLRAYLIPALQYADKLKEEISHSVLDFDRVMKWGFGWQKGPFEMIDAISHDALGISSGDFYSKGKQLTFAGKYTALPKEPQFASVADFAVFEKRETFNLRDVGDGITCLSLSTKMGVITPQLVYEMLQLLESRPPERLLLTSEAKNFSVGFDLNFFAGRIAAADWEAIETALANLQKLSMRLGEIPSVAMVFGHTLGAGLELALGCSTIVAEAESKIGFPEAKVGLIPGGAGAVRARINAQTGGAKHLADMAMRLTLGTVSENADQARMLGILSTDDRTCYSPDRLLHEAKATALDAAPSEISAWISGDMPLTGMIDRLQDEAKAKGQMTDHDELIGDKIKHVFSRSTSFEDALIQERKGFVELCKSGLTLARIKHMLENGKPLRN